MKGPYSLGSVPEEQRLFTTSEVAKMAGITEAAVRSFVARFNIEVTISKTSNSRAAFYTWKSAQQVVDLAKHRRRPAEIKKEQMEKNADSSEHPLVTDKRCLDFNYWPDVVPVCFKE